MANIRIARESDKVAWDTFVLSQKSSGPYHLFAWKQAVEKAYRHQAIYLMAEGKAGDILGVLPLTLVKPPLLRGSLVSQPFCDYGGVLASGKDIARQLIDKALELAQAYHAKLEIRCIQPDPCLEVSPEFYATSHKSRMILNQPESSDSLWKSLKSKVRSQVRRPKKDGMHFRLGSRELASAFYAVFSRNMRELGSPVHSRGWIDSVLDAFRDRSHVGMVYKGSLPVAGGIILQSRDTVCIPWASSLSEYKRSSPNMLLYWGFLQYTADNGFKYFDFGRSTPDEGTYRFKAQWGAKPVPLFWYSRKNAQSERVAASPASTHRLAFEKAWSKLPEWIVNKLGPRIRGYITL